MKITKRQLRRIIREAIGSSYAGRYSDVSSHGGGYGDYRTRQQRQENEWRRKDQEKEQRDQERELIGQLHVKLRKIYEENPKASMWSVVDDLGGGWGDSFMDEIERYWAILKKYGDE
tara:strand:+ start:484 stop:834 length:351 start_codon:yes stop_codon:yes gene_type:complete